MTFAGDGEWLDRIAHERNFAITGVPTSVRVSLGVRARAVRVHAGIEGLRQGL